MLYIEKYLLSCSPSTELGRRREASSFEEAAAVTEIDAGYEYAEDATADNTFSNLSGLEYFTSLERLNLKYHRVSDATPIEGLASLTSLNLGENQITKLDLSKLANLTDLRLYGTGVSTLDLSKTPLLKSLYLQRTALTEIDLSPLTDLEEAYINEAKLTKLPCRGIEGSDSSGCREKCPDDGRDRQLRRTEPVASGQQSSDGDRAQRSS